MHKKMTFAFRKELGAVAGAAHVLIGLGKSGQVDC